MDIRVLLDDMVRRMGYRTYPGFPDEYIWVDHGDGTGEVIMLLEGSDIEKVREFQSSTSSFPGERFIFILTGKIDPEILSYCKYYKITVIHEDEVAKILGRAVIQMHLERPKERKRENGSEEKREYITVYLEEGENPKYIKPTIEGQDVIKSIGLRPELIFVPYHFFSYALKVMEGEIVADRQGTLMVNAVNGKVSKSINGFELLESWPTSHREIEMKWEPLPSLERARKWLSESIETEVTERKETESFIIFTKKSVRPLEDTIKVKFINTCFYPIYSSSAVAMDGFTGEIGSISDFL
ncbi:MAG: hypothetical protein ACP5UO_01670 [Thermoplasmata archaeon]